MTDGSKIADELLRKRRDGSAAEFSRDDVAALSSFIEYLRDRLQVYNRLEVQHRKLVNALGVVRSFTPYGEDDE